MKRTKQAKQAKHFTVALTGQDSQLTYQRLCRGETVLPAPEGCDSQLLRDIRPDRNTAPVDRPLVLLYMPHRGFVASFGMWTTYDDQVADPAKKHTIHLVRDSFRPFSEPVPVDAVAKRLQAPEAAVVRRVGQGVVPVSKDFYADVLRLGGIGTSNPQQNGSLPPTNGVYPDPSPAENPKKHEHQVNPDMYPGGRYGRRRAGQGVRETHLETLSRCVHPPRRLFGLLGREENNKALRKRINDIDEAERRWGAGARGEELVGSILEKLGIGFYVFHDVQVLDRYGRVEGNVDHAVIGPSGVFAVETKNWVGTTLVKTTGEGGKQPRYKDAPADLTKEVQQARSSATALERILEIQQGYVAPLLCMCHGFIVGEGQVHGDHRDADVRILAPNSLPGAIRTRPSQLDSKDAGELANMLLCHEETSHP